MKIPYDELLSHISIGDVVSFKLVEQLENDPSFRQKLEPSSRASFITTDNWWNPEVNTREVDKTWIHIPTQERVYVHTNIVHSNYIAYPGEKFVILDGREITYMREEEGDESTPLNLFSPRAKLGNKSRVTPVKTYAFRLQKANPPYEVLSSVICDVLNFEIKYGNVRILAEVKR